MERGEPQKLDWAKDNVIGLIQPPLTLKDGPDVIAVTEVDGGAGLTILVQNPYEASILFAVGIQDKESTASDDDALALELTPLEIGVLVVPLEVEPNRDTEIRLGGGPGSEQSRLRPVVASHLAKGETLKGVLGGLGQAFIFGFGRMRLVWTGGEVANPFKTTVQFGVRRIDTATVRYERFWARPDAQPPDLQYRRHEGAIGWSNRAYYLGFAGAAAGGFLGAWIGSLIHGFGDVALGWYFFAGLPAGWFLVWRAFRHFGWMHTRYRSLLPPDPLVRARPISKQPSL